MRGGSGDVRGGSGDARGGSGDVRGGSCLTWHCVEVNRVWQRWNIRSTDQNIRTTTETVHRPCMLDMTGLLETEASGAKHVWPGQPW